VREAGAAQGQGAGAAPLVSVCMLTYNHEPFLRQALDSVLMQQTDFDFEILVNDDCSTDGTVAILQEYEAAHPGRIRLFLQKENWHQKGMQYPYIRFLIPQARGRYVALNDGDDFWTDPTKLQRQADYLEAHPDCTVCFHPARIEFSDGTDPDVMPREAKDFTLYDLIERNFMRVNSVVYRLREGMFDLRLDGCYAIDWTMNLAAARLGRIGYIDRVMSVWRRHESSVSWNAHRDIPALLRQHWLGILNRYFVEYRMFAGDARARAMTERKMAVHLRALRGVGVPRGRKAGWLLRLALRFPLLTARTFVRMKTGKV